MKERPSIAETAAGRQIDLSDEHSENTHLWISRSFEPDSNVTDESLSKPPKHFSQRTSTDAGTQIDSSEEQLENVHSSIFRRVDPGSNVNNLRDVISERASGSTASDAGRQSDSNRSHAKNDRDAIVSRFDTGSKTKDGKVEHPTKQSSRMKRTDFGIKIDLGEEQWANADSPISRS
jgi:hypothetical protein